ncbi:MAG: CRTAC1 family protein, partial [Saprospiraceae bacterium]|nr:CRTAC1 family protein [Saprospiraceae bacterium]
MNKHFLIILLLSLIISSCQNDEINTHENALFTALPSNKTNIDFSNDLTITDTFNPYTFKSFYNGGGVALGDINNDGLVDIYLSGNMVDNKLYINKGNFEFEDITLKSGVSCSGVWSTGVSFVDINHDGFLDIYVCKSGQPNMPNRHNQMFINNQDLTFTDVSKSYGLDFVGLAVHAAFFDYDKDGDLDCYLLNNSIRSVGGYDIAEGLREIPDEKGGNKLLKNLEVETGKIVFENVSNEAGIFSSAIGFGLGVSIADLNEDGWDDMYVSNDFFERDYLYINNKDGTFNETITSVVDEMSLGSMGADIADLNNDGRPEIFVTEMLPQSNLRYKSKTAFESFDKAALNASKGYHNQYGRNVLQYNMGIKNGLPYFAELARYHKMEATDWSWGALMADFDNNGLRDVFVANGIRRDLLDQDHINFYNPSKIGSLIKENSSDVFKNMLESFPSEPLSNYFFMQEQKDSFVTIQNASFQTPGFSNGATYGDLDNDGDLDLVINNIDTKATILKNNSTNDHFLKVILEGESNNTKAIGTKVTIFVEDDIYMGENHPMRGYQSTADHNLHFGLGRYSKIDSIKIQWPNLRISMHYDVAVDTTFKFKYSEIGNQESNVNKKVISSSLLQKVNYIFDYTHQENKFNDFDRNRVQNYFISNEGPEIFVEDINNDNKEDILITGSKGYESVLYQQTNSGFKKINIPVFTKYK